MSKKKDIIDAVKKHEFDEIFALLQSDKKYSRLLEKIIINPEKYGIDEISRDQKLLLIKETGHIDLGQPWGRFQTRSWLTERALINPEKYGLGELSKEERLELIINSGSYKMSKAVMENPNLYGLENITISEKVDLICSIRDYKIDIKTLWERDIRLHRDVIENLNKYGFENASSEDILKLIENSESAEIAQKVLDNMEKYGIDSNNEASIARICSIIPGKNIDDRFSILKKNLNDHEKVDKVKSRVEKLQTKNKMVYSTFNYEFISDDEIFSKLEEGKEEGYTEEQLLRLSNYPEVQRFIVGTKKNEYMNKAISYVLKNDSNYIITLNRLINNEKNYQWILDVLPEGEKVEDEEKFIEQFIMIISEDDNYFGVKNSEDIIKYTDKKNKICEDILNGDMENLPEGLKKFGDIYGKEGLLKFAILEYHFGISINEANRIIQRYGKDTEDISKLVKSLTNKKEQDEEVQQFNITGRYLKALKQIVECKNIEELIKKEREKNNSNIVGKPWNDTSNDILSVRNVESKILNMFEKLYNDVIYKAEEHDEDKIQSEKYIDAKGEEHEIATYYIKKDFNLRIRTEGAYAAFEEPEDFKTLYNNPSIENHGNCECFISNDSISPARNNYGIIVGYREIKKNSLTSAGPYDLYTSNESFYSYDEKSEFRTPKQMIDNTRHTHNEMVTERLLLDENGNAIKSHPDYAIWIEEDLKEERFLPSGEINPKWVEQREKNPQWIMTKKMAAQLRSATYYYR